LIVVGHRRPDLDSIAAALGYSALCERQGRPAIARRAGPVDVQTAWALERFGLAAPEPLVDAAPTFGAVASAEPAQPPTISLDEAIRRIAAGVRAVPVADEAGRPLALVDARACVLALGAPEGSRRGLLLARPLIFRADERVADRRSEIARVDPDDYLVVDAAELYVGVASRAAALAPPRLRLALVDHNEIGQAVPGADQADIVEVLDHHRLGNPATKIPIPFTVDVVGSTATLVEERWRGADLSLPCPLAGLLLAALLSDTLALRSPTTTGRDRDAAARLARRAGVDDLEMLGREVVTAGAGLGNRSAQEIVEEDFKEYDTDAGRVVAAQAEVRMLQEIAPRVADLAEALERLRSARSAVVAVMLLTDPVRGVSRLLATGEPRLIGRLPYASMSDGTLDAGATVSRKTQLVPALLSALSD
jgi:manganese-dependent inorganic pyrophosphatase